MKKYNHLKLKLSLFALGAIFLTAAAEVPAPKLVSLTRPQKANYRTDQIIVQMKPPSANSIKTMGLEKAQVSSLEKTARDSSLIFKSTISTGAQASAPLGIFEVDESKESVEQAIARLNSNPDVELVQPDFIYRTSAVPNDPQYGKLWGLKNTAQTIVRGHSAQSIYSTSNPGVAAKDIEAEAAWDKVTDCSSVIVAVIDTGVDLNHDDLKDNLWSNASNQNGRDFINGDTDPSDDNGHGTHVAGTIGARGGNAVGTTGVCWRVKIMAIKVLGADGSGGTSQVIQGINYAVANGAHIINMSLGGGSFDQAYLTALNAASTAGVLTVVAAGNDGLSNNTFPTYPCNFPTANLICVGAVDQAFNMASFSNYSTTHVDIGAPGTNIVSAAPNAWSDFDLPLLSSDWTTPVGTSGASFGFSANDYLQYPQNFDGSTIQYAAGAQDTATTTFDMNGNEGAAAIFFIQGNAEENNDGLGVFNCGSVSCDPFALVTNYLGSFTGSIPTLSRVATDLDRCRGATECTLGLNFESDTAIESFGYQIQKIIIDYKVPSTAGEDGMNGTSMATPHVAGLAALVKAYNPAFTAKDLKDAVLTTGTKVTALTSRFGRGSVINAPSALKYVDPPTAVTLTIAP